MKLNLIKIHLLVLGIKNEDHYAWCKLLINMNVLAYRVTPPYTI
jgi:hypothetical protein